MSDKYLLPCNCGKSVSVGTSQAGQVVTCACGQKLNVPSMRAIRQLPPATESKTNQRPTRTWNPVKGSLFAIGTILILGGLITAGHSYLVYSQVAEIKPSEVEFHDSLETIGNMKADEVLDSWHFVKEHPLEKAGSSGFAMVRDLAREKLNTIYAGLFAIGLGLVLAFIAPVFVRVK